MRQAEIARLLVPFANAGHHVTVETPEDGEGLRVLVDKPGQHISFRISPDATAEEWATAVFAATVRSLQEQE